ncbi:hypothetical protein D3C75_967680 [compost metagenome]
MIGSLAINEGFQLIGQAVLDFGDQVVRGDPLAFSNLRQGFALLQKGTQLLLGDAQNSGKVRLAGKAAP